MSLLELLIVVAAILVLLALVSTAAVRAKHSAGATVELSNMRSLGVAAVLYVESFEKWPVTATTLVKNQNISSSLLQSPLDKTQVGIANAIIAYHAQSAGNLRSLIPKYPMSFLGLGDLGYDQSYFEENIQTQSAAGWLIALTESEPTGKNTYGRFKGLYKRLLIDASVQRRFHSSFEPGRIDHPAFWFADGDESWKSRISSP